MSCQGYKDSSQDSSARWPHLWKEGSEVFSHNHSPSIPQLSAGQFVIFGCQVMSSPEVESGRQTRFFQSSGSEQQQQRSVSAFDSYLQSSASRFVQGLPGDASLHSDNIVIIKKEYERDLGPLDFVLRALRPLRPVRQARLRSGPPLWTILDHFRSF